MEHYIDQLKYAYPNYKNETWNNKELKIATETYKKEVLNAWVNIMASQLTEKEVSELIDFMKTPLGKKFVKLQQKVDLMINL